MGRSQYQGRGGGGRGRGSSQGRRSQGNDKKKIKSKEYKFHLHGTHKHNQQTATFTQVKDVIVAYIQRTFTDGHEIARSIREEAPITIEKPEREMSDAETDAEKAAEQVVLDMAYQAELREYAQRKRTFGSNQPKAYSLIFPSIVRLGCSTSSKMKPTSQPSYEIIPSNSLSA